MEEEPTVADGLFAIAMELGNLVRAIEQLKKKG
jgi:hypothetical protein